MTSLGKSKDAFGKTKTDQELIEIGYYAPSRNSDTAHKRLDELIEINACALRYPEGLPSGGPDNASRIALRTAFALIGPLTVWAINHTLGRLILNLTPVPGAPRGFPDTPEQVDARVAVNSPQLEQLGAEYEFNDVRVNREILAALIEAIASGIPRPNTRWQFLLFAADDLRALNVGVTRRLLKASGPRKKGDAHAAEELKIRALEHIAYRKGVGLGTEAAISEVGNAYGVDVTDWWRRDKGTRPALITRRLEYAEARGRIAREYKTPAKRISGDHLPLLSVEEYGGAALVRDGRAYQAARAKLKRPKSAKA